MQTLVTRPIVVLALAAWIYAPGLAQAQAAGQTERLAADTPKTTTGGNGFIAPAGWTVTVRGAATILEAPEGGSRIALVDVQGADAAAAVAAAWAI